MHVGEPFMKCYNCGKVEKNRQDGKLRDIEERWIAEKNKWNYISLE